jgi:erythronate-4-phosphate dehydrogenase
LNIVADERVAALDETFARHGEVLRLPGQEIAHRHLRDARALIVRTVTQVDQALLQGTAVRFVGTATIGTDHLDTAWLEHAGITWTAAPGCNADATAQYTLAMYLLACQRIGVDPLAQRFGIVGCGNVGGRLKALLERLGVPAIACDPPLEAKGEKGFHPLEDILDCDVISLHVPLTRLGRWPTLWMFDQAIFEHLSPRTILINAARGDVIAARALRDWLGRGGRAALDVWPGEPRIEAAILEKAFCGCFGFEAGPEQAPPASPPPATLDIKDETFMEDLLSACPVARDDAAMRSLLDAPPAAREAAFEALRANYPLRRDVSL